MIADELIMGRAIRVDPLHDLRVGMIWMGTYSTAFGRQVQVRLGRRRPLHMSLSVQRGHRKLIRNPVSISFRASTNPCK